MRHIEEIITRQIHHYNEMQRLLAAGQKPKPEKPARPSICMARRLGAGARTTVRILSERLNYEIYGRKLIDEVATDMHVQRLVINGLDETGDPELGVLFRTLGDGHTLTSDEYFSSLMRIVRALSREGGVIMLGRGSHMIAHDTAGLRIMMTASDATCVRRIREYDGVDEKSAEARLEENNVVRAKFMRKYFRHAPTDGSQFDLTINTDRITPEQAAEVIISTLQVRGYPESALKDAHGKIGKRPQEIVTAKY